MKHFSLLLLLLGSFLITACGGSSNNNDDDPIVDTDGDTVADTTDNCVNDMNADQADADNDGIGDVCDPINGDVPTTYTFESPFAAGESAVSYTGQTARQMLIESIVTTMLTYTSDDVAATVVDDLNFYFEGNAALDDSAIGFSRDGVTLTPDNGSGVNTFGAISTGKNLIEKIAGNDTGMDSTELNMTDGLVNEEFFGWDEVGFTATGGVGERPEDFVQYLFGLLEVEVTDNVVPQISTVGGDVALDVSYVDYKGRDLRQLIQKFLLGAVTFSQGTSDYLQTDFSADNEQDETNPFSAGAHDWDESFGYFGAARNYNDYTDDEIASSPDEDTRDDYENGYNDANTDGLIDLRSEINLANSTNCAKRDIGTADNTNPTDFTADVFDAFLTGRKILNDAEAAAADASAQVDLTAAQALAIEEAGDVVAQVWEKCVAATVVHYINDVTADIGEYDSGDFASLDNYRNVAKHWGEMMGFALGLQFNAESPIYATTENTAAFKEALAAMGNAPVLADGSQNGVAGAATSIDDYLAGLQTARDTLESLYEFDSENVANW